MPSHKQLPIALTIAGSDSGGGAGIQADLKTFAGLAVHGLTVLTSVTAQNPRRVLGIEPCSPKIVRLQMEAVFHGFRPLAVKTGMLFSGSIVRAVAQFLSKFPRAVLVVDPVMVSTSGAHLLKPDACKALCADLFPLAALITPNLREAEVLLGRNLRNVEDLRTAARELHRRFGCAVLAKGGHLRGLKQAVDIFYDGKDELLLSAPFIHGVKTHGTGCTYSAAITACLARGLSLADSVRKAKAYITRAIALSQKAAGHDILRW